MQRTALAHNRLIGKILNEELVREVIAKRAFSRPAIFIRCRYTVPTSSSNDHRPPLPWISFGYLEWALDFLPPFILAPLPIQNDVAIEPDRLPSRTERTGN